MLVIPTLLAILPLLLSTTTAVPTGAVATGRPGPTPWSKIAAKQNSNSCVSIRTSSPETPIQEGDSVVFAACSLATNWRIRKDGLEGFIVQTEAVVALDVGAEPVDGGLLTVEKFDLGAQQTWIYTEDEQIKNPSSNQCLELTLPNGSLATGTCDPANTRQKFRLYDV